MPETERRMTDERLGQLEEAVNAMDAGARSSTCYHPSVVDELITELRAERTENARLREQVDSAERELNLIISGHSKTNREMEENECPECGGTGRVWLPDIMTGVVKQWTICHCQYDRLGFNVTTDQEATDE